MGETFGPYQLIARLGRGGMAEVFLARLGAGGVAKHLAIKRLLPGFARSPHLVQRLVDEARLCVWLQHPNIVQVFDFGRIGETYFIAMEYVDGCDLKTLLAPPGTSSLQLPMEVALELGFQILDALRHAHSCSDSNGKPLGLVHRDVTPHNILISRDGHPKLADFGVARAALEVRDRTSPGVILGKQSYMAPEQALGRACDQRVDLYGAGATIYEMLTGSKPFGERAGPPSESWDRPPAPPSILRPSIPASLDAVILKAMAPRPEERFSCADEMGAAILKELATAGGPPKPHQIRNLVAGAIRQRRKGRLISAGSGVTPLDFPVGEGSLIASEVTQVRQLHSIYDDLPVLEEIVDELPPAEPLVVVSAERRELTPADEERADAEPLDTPERRTGQWRPRRHRASRLEPLRRGLEVLRRGIQGLRRGRLDGASWLVLAILKLGILTLGLWIGHALRCADSAPR